MTSVISSQSKPKYARISTTEAQHLFAKIIDQSGHSHSEGPPVIVLDLDGTLIDNRPRTAAILRDLGEHWREKYPEESVELRAIVPNKLSYLLADSLRRLKILEPSLVAEATEFWRHRFFADDDLRHDIAVLGAVPFVRACHRAGATVVYLTGRDLPMMGLGTFHSLRMLDFPLGVAGVEFILKPDAQMADEAFKRMVAPSLVRIGKVIAAFDNEPANCNLFKEAYPESEVVFIDTQHVPGAPQLRSDIKIIDDFTAAIPLCGSTSSWP